MALLIMALLIMALLTMVHRTMDPRTTMAGVDHRGRRPTTMTLWWYACLESSSPQPQDLEVSHPQKVAHELVVHITNQVSNPVTALDVGIDTHEFYASRMMQPRTGSIVGLATDPRVATAYNTHASTEQLAKERMHAVFVPNMFDLSQLNGHAFDIVMCAQPIEQRPDISNAIPKLAELLKPGGRIYFASLDLSLRAVQRGETSDSPMYRNERVEDICNEAGLTDCQTTRIDTYGYLPTEPGVLYVIEATKPSHPHAGSSSMHIDTRTFSSGAQSPVLV
ncbi:hypothetical protein BKA62DRAFT_767338 [Auriculariales sp. MPI-PUGE-AT-0066]|nr:hypothetical protein BKA62DRAFT_767338 [Auriculariales sp. MPI-PUGE-AT-0066]